MSHSDRNKKYIDPKIQGALVRRIMLHWVVFVCMASLAAFALQVLTNPFLTFGEHAMQVWWIHGSLFLVMACLLPAFVYDTVKLSHRFAGPIYRLRKTIGSIAAGSPATRLKFRRHDYWQGLAEDFNTMIERLTKGEDYLGEVRREETAGRFQDEGQPGETDPSDLSDDRVHPVETA